MASIETRVNKDGEVTSYRIEVCLGYEKDGTKIKERVSYKPKATTPAKARKEVEQFAVEFEKKVRDGSAFTSGDKITLNEFVKIWEENSLELKVKSGEMTLHTKEDYVRTMERYALKSIGHMKLSKIRATHIDKIVLKLLDEGKKPKTIRNAFNIIRSCFDYAFRKEIIKENPCIRCERLPEVKRGSEVHFWTEDQVQRFLKDALTMEYEVRIKGHTRRYTVYNGTGKPFEVQSYTEKRSFPYQMQVYFYFTFKSLDREGTYTNYSYGGEKNATLIGGFTYDGEEHAVVCDSTNVNIQYAEYEKNAKTGEYTKKLGEYSTEAPTVKDAGFYWFKVKVTVPASGLLSSEKEYTYDITLAVTPADALKVGFDAEKANYTSGNYSGVNYYSYKVTEGTDITVEDYVTVTGAVDADKEALQAVIEKYGYLKDVPTKAGDQKQVGLYLDKSIATALEEDEELVALLSNYEGLYDKLASYRSDDDVVITWSNIDDLDLDKPIDYGFFTVVAKDQAENDVDFNTTAAYKTYKAAKKGTYKNKLSSNKTINSKATATYGTISYKLKQGGSKIVIDKATGKITVRKGLKKGTHKVTVVATVAATDDYTAAKETHQITIKVK